MISPYVADLATVKILSKEEERVAFLAYRDEGCLDSKRRLIESNLRLVFSIARGYTKANSEDMLEHLISAGNEGLLHALTKYDPEKGTKFSTYCGSWVLMYIRKYVLEEMPLIKPPSSIRRKAKMAKSLSSRLHTVSLAVYSQKAVDPAADPAATFQEDFDSSYRLQILKQAVGFLPPRESLIVSSYYGFLQDRRSLREIGEQLGLSSERIRQLRNSAEKKLSRWLPLWNI
jgi:RNA polymerase sigma factor (sigma-70 family)